MKRLIVAMLLSASLAPLQAAESPQPDEFAVQFPLADVTDGLNALEFDERVYRAATQRRLNDVRVFNAAGEAMPLALLPPGPQAPPDVRTHELAIAALPAQTAARDALLRTYALRFERDRERAVVEIMGESVASAPGADIGAYLIDARPMKDMSGRLVLAFAPDARDYAGRVDVFGSEDLVNWRALGHGPLARERRLGEAIEKNRVDLSHPPSFLRVTWSGSIAPQLAAARFEELTPVAGKLPRALLATSVGDEGRSLYAELPPALPTERLVIRLPQANMSERVTVYRHVADPAPRTRRLGLLPRRAPEHWVAVGSFDVFRVMRDGVEVEGLPLAFAVPTDGIRIDFARPLTGTLPVVEAEWRPARIAFAARAPAPYRLAVGREEASASPSLDLRAVLPADDAAGMKLPIARIEVAGPAAGAGGDTARAARIAAQAHWSRALLWGVLAVAVAGLAWMAWRLSAQLRSAAAAPRTDARR